MLGNNCQYAGQGADAQRPVPRDSEVVLAYLLCGEPEMAPGLTGHLVTQSRQDPGQFLPRYIPREPHTAMSSSLTKWSRMTLGLSLSSK